MTVILSIKPKWWNLIKNGKKTIEVRKSFNDEIDKIVFYTYSPIKKVVGECKCKSLKFNINGEYVINLIHKYTNSGKYQSCISLPELKRYAFAADILNIIKLSHVVKYDTPKDLKDYGIKRPPQNYCYLSDKPKDMRKKSKIQQLLKG